MKSRSMAGVAAAAAAAAAAADAEIGAVEIPGVADAAEIGFVTGTACAAVANGGKLGTCAVIAAELSSGGSTESDFGGKEIGAAVAEEDVDDAAGGAVGVGVQVDDPVGAEG